MKKIIYCIAFLGAILIGCNPNEDIYNDIDARDNPIIGEATITLTDEDYEEIGIADNFFETIDDAEELIPDFLSGLYPQWGNGSSVLVGYELEFGSDLEEVMEYANATVYQLGLADYAATGEQGSAFYPSLDADDFLPEILDAAIDMPEDGDIVLARYDQFFETPEVGLANIYQASFPTNYDNFENIDVLGDQGWTAGSANAQGSGFNGGAFPNEDWLISPEIDLTGETALKFQINQEIDLFGAPEESIDIIVSTNYATGTDPTAATWVTFTFDKSIYGSLTLSEDFDFSAFDGETIHIAFKYTSTDMTSARWRVESFAIKTIGVEGDVNNKGAYYEYDGSRWEAIEKVYYLSKSDYDAMGEDSGRPGRFNNFSSSIDPENYIPRFLSSTAPYNFAQEEDELVVIYKFFNGSTVTRGNSYSVINGVWSPDKTELQFGNDGNKWVPDNTIRYAFTDTDIAFVSSEFATKYEGPADNVGFFGSFDRRESSDNYWNDDMLLEAIGAVLDNINPGAADGQKYVVTLVVYTGVTEPENKAVIKKAGEWIYQ